MAKPRLFYYAILWHPTDKQIKDEGKKSTVLVQPTITLAGDERQVMMAAAMQIPSDKKEELEQIEIAVSAF